MECSQELVDVAAKRKNETLSLRAWKTRSKASSTKLTAPQRDERMERLKELDFEGVGILVFADQRSLTATRKDTSPHDDCLSRHDSLKLIPVAVCVGNGITSAECDHLSGADVSL